MSRQHVGTVDAVAEQAVTFNGIPEGVTFDEAGWVSTADMVSDAVAGVVMEIEQ